MSMPLRPTSGAVPNGSLHSPRAEFDPGIVPQPEHQTIPERKVPSLGTIGSAQPEHGPVRTETLGYGAIAVPKASAPAAASANPEWPLGPFSAEPNMTYATYITWQGQQRPLTLRVGAEIAEFMKEKGIQIDLQNAAFVRQGKTPESWYSPDARAAYEKERGEKAPEWLVFLGEFEDMQRAPDKIKSSYAVPTNIELTSWGKPPKPGQIVRQIRVFDLWTEFQVFEGRGHSESFNPSDIVRAEEPIEISQSSLASKILAPGIKVTGLSQNSLKLVEQSIQDVLGRTLSNLSVQQEAAKVELEALAVWERELEQAQRSHDEAKENDAVVQSIHLLPTLGTGPITITRALKGIDERRLDLKRVINPDIEIVAVPRGKHWTSMPQWDSQRERVATSPTSLGMTTGITVVDDQGELRSKRLVFIPEESPETQRHELYHLLDEDFLTPAQRMIVDHAFEEAVRNRGPFARPYGAQRREFFSTWGELFEGAEGAEGQIVFKDNVRALYDLVVELTGRAP